MVGVGRERKLPPFWHCSLSLITSHRVHCHLASPCFSVVSEMKGKLFRYRFEHQMGSFQKGAKQLSLNII